MGEVVVDESVAQDAVNAMQMLVDWGVETAVEQSFRDETEQTARWNSSRRGGNAAAKPGTSRHESGTALDMRQQGMSADMYGRLNFVMGYNGFARTNGERWHFEHRPTMSHQGLGAVNTSMIARARRAAPTMASTGNLPACKVKTAPANTSAQ